MISTSQCFYQYRAVNLSVWCVFRCSPPCEFSESEPHSLFQGLSKYRRISQRPVDLNIIRQSSATTFFYTGLDQTTFLTFCDSWPEALPPFSKYICPVVIMSSHFPVNCRLVKVVKCPFFVRCFPLNNGTKYFRKRYKQLDNCRLGLWSKRAWYLQPLHFVHVNLGALCMECSTPEYTLERWNQEKVLAEACQMGSMRGVNPWNCRTPWRQWASSRLLINDMNMIFEGLEDRSAPSKHNSKSKFNVAEVRQFVFVTLGARLTLKGIGTQLSYNLTPGPTHTASTPAPEVLYLNWS